MSTGTTAKNTAMVAASPERRHAPGCGRGSSLEGRHCEMPTLDGRTNGLGPTCIKCFGNMALCNRIALNGGYGLRYEHRTFRCNKCQHEQTYTAGTCQTPLGENRLVR